MAQSDIIQKDLGLVTAYGYALAGGYQGTEEQFKRDFAALMSGQYTALGNKPSINGVTLVGNKTTEDLGIETGAKLKYYESSSASDEVFTTTLNASSVLSSLYTYGNISFITLTVVPDEDIVMNSNNRHISICRTGLGQYGNNLLDVTTVGKYINKWTSVGTRQSGTYSIAEIIGLSRYHNSAIGNKAYPSTYIYSELRYQNIIKYLYIDYFLNLNDGVSELTIPKDSFIVVDHMFINSIGVYDNDIYDPS